MSLSYSHIMNHCIFKIQKNYIAFLSGWFVLSLSLPRCSYKNHDKVKKGVTCVFQILWPKKDVDKFPNWFIMGYVRRAYLSNLKCFFNLLGQKLQVYLSVYMKLDQQSARTKQICFFLLPGLRIHLWLIEQFFCLLHHLNSSWLLVAVRATILQVEEINSILQFESFLISSWFQQYKWVHAEWFC